jgi:glycosyltransferase involved in cell wall biosynthesis
MESVDLHPRKVLLVAPIGDMLIRFRWHLIKAMVDKGNTVITASAEEDGVDGFLNLDVPKELLKLGVHHHHFPLQRVGNNPLKDLKTLWALYRLCRRERPDILVSMTAKPIVYGAIAGWLALVPRRVQMVTGLPYGVAKPSKGAGFTYRIAHTLFRFALRRGHHIIFQNPDDLREVEEARMIGPRVTTGIVNGSGVDLDYFRPVPLPTEPMTFLMIARLLKPKGVGEFLEASRAVKALHPSVQFVLVGPMENHPEAIDATSITAWVIDGIGEWLGPVSDIRIPMANASVYVLPSYHEGTPRTVLEAMAMGRPIITTDAPGCRETVVPEVNGYLIPVGSAEALAISMRYFLMDPNKIQAFGTQSHRIATEKFEAGRVASQTIGEIMSHR